MNYIGLHSNIFRNVITDQGFSNCKSGRFSLVIWSLGAESFYKSLIHFFCNLKIQIRGKDSNICPVQSFQGLDGEQGGAVPAHIERLDIRVLVYHLIAYLVGIFNLNKSLSGSDFNVGIGFP